MKLQGIMQNVSTYIMTPLLPHSETLRKIKKVAIIFSTIAVVGLTIALVMKNTNPIPTTAEHSCHHCLQTKWSFTNDEYILHDANSTLTNNQLKLTCLVDILENGFVKFLKKIRAIQTDFIFIIPCTIRATNSIQDGGFCQNGCDVEIAFTQPSFN